jgi:hypothetical protein
MAKSTASQIAKRLTAVEAALGLSTGRTDRWKDGTPRCSKPTEAHKKIRTPIQPTVPKQETTEKTNCILADYENRHEEI